MMQQDLPYTTGRGQWIADIRALRIRSLPAKMLLMMIDSHIPPGRSYWDMTPEELARECGMHKVTYYRSIKLLIDAGLVAVEEAAFPDRRRYRLIRSAIADEAAQCREDEAYELCVPAPDKRTQRSESEQSVAVRNSDPVADRNSDPVADRNSAVADRNSAVADRNSAVADRNCTIHANKELTDTNTGRAETADAIALPEVLDCAPFREAWTDWLAYRRSKRKPVTVRAANMQLGKLAAWGVPRAVAAIEQSIANDWQGLFPEKASDERPAETYHQRQQRANFEALRAFVHEGGVCPRDGPALQSEANGGFLEGGT